MADKKISKLYADNYVKPIEDGILVPVSVKEGAKWVSGAISTTDMKEYMSRKLADVFEKKGEGVSTATIHPGTGITVEEHEDGGVVLNVKTHNLYEVVTELPETGESDKIYVVTSSNGGSEGNVKTEYAFIDSTWEKLGEFVAPTVDADDVVTPSQMSQAINNAVKDLKNYDDTAIKDRLDILEEIDHATFALKSEIPSLDGYAKTADLAPYAKTADLAPYAKTADIVIPTKVSDLTNDEGFLTEDDLPSLDGYALKTSLEAAEALITALTTRVKDLEDKLAHYDARFGYNTSVNGNEGWTKSFLLLEDNTPVEA